MRLRGFNSIKLRNSGEYFKVTFLSSLKDFGKGNQSYCVGPTIKVAEFFFFPLTVTKYMSIKNILNKILFKI